MAHHNGFFLVGSSILLKPKVVVSVSGGVDSMALLKFLSNCPQRIAAVLYVQHSMNNHSVQKAYSITTGNVVKDFCTLHNLPFAHRTSHSDLGNEAEWREGRLKAYAEVCSMYNAERVLTAHHFQDAVESYLMNMSKGMLKTIPWVTQFPTFQICHPLLLTPKEVLVEYAVRNNVMWVEDPTNAEVNYCSRNKVRHALPVICEALPQLKSAVRRLLLNTAPKEDK